jgi:hypothetical protein
MLAARPQTMAWIGEVRNSVVNSLHAGLILPQSHISRPFVRRSFRS